MDNEKITRLASQGPKLYTTTDIMQILQITKRTVYNHIKTGRLKTIKVGGQHRVTEDGLKEFLGQGQEKHD